MEGILRRHLRLSDEEWLLLERRDLTFGAQDSLDRGFADEFGEFAPPIGAKVFNI
jgi:hypothetical protein